MSLVPADAEFFHLDLCRLDARCVLIGVKNGLHSEPAFRFRGPNQIHDRQYSTIECLIPKSPKQRN